MATTSLKLPEDIKLLATEAAKRQGVTTHAFMVDAIRSAAVAAEMRASFIADAVAARQQVDETGKSFAAEDVHAYIRARATGKKISRPRAKSWRK